MNGDDDDSSSDTRARKTTLPMFDARKKKEVREINAWNETHKDHWYAFRQPVLTFE